MADNRELALVLKLVADQFQSELKKSQGLLGDFNSFIRSWQVQLTAAGSALFAVAKSTANYGDELVKTSQRLGTTVEETARLQHAAKLSDTDLQGLSTTVAKLSKNMVDASMGSTEAKETFHRLGINVLTAGGQLKGTTDILLEMSDKFRLMPDGPEKTGLAIKTLGKAGKEVLPLLNSDLREAFHEADKLGLVMSEKAARSAEHFNDELTKLQGAIRGVTNDLGTALIPKFDALAHAMTTVITDAREAARAIAGLDKVESPNVGTVAPSGGGRNLRIMPAPDKAAISGFQTERFFPVEKTLQQLQEDYRLYITGLTAMGEQHIARQEHLGKALLDIHLSQNNAIEIQNKLVREEANQYMLMLDRAEQLKQIDEQTQEAKGKAIVDNTKVEVSIRDAAFARERDSLTANAQAWVSYFEQIGGSAEGLYTAKQDLLRAELAKELQLEQEQAAKLLLAWQTYDYKLRDQILASTDKTLQERETLEINYMRRSIQNKRELGGDMWEGFSEGMRRFAQDNGPFGMMQNAARQTAQAMQSSFQSLFFDFMQGKMKSLTDLFSSAFRFMQQLVAQILSQMATTALIGNSFGGGAGLGGMSLAGAFAGSSGTSLFTTMDTGWWDNTKEFFGFSSAYAMNQGGVVPVQRFAFGGPVYSNNDSVPALLTPGEFVVNRRGVEALHRLNQGDIATGGPTQRPVVVNMNVSTPDASSFRQSREQLMAELSAGMMRAARRNL